MTATVPVSEDAYGRDHAEADEQADVSLETDPVSGLLASLSWSWKDVQQARLAAQQRGLDTLAGELEKFEKRIAEQVKKELRKEPVWPWLSQYPGLGGVQMARLVALIGDARRFPGQRCTEGHYAPAIYAIGDPCPSRSRPDADGVVTACDGTMLAPRPHSGTRSLWHYLGLHVVNGRSPRKSKGTKADWNPIGRTICLQPGGLAEQIVRLKVPKYREIYDAKKERLARERGAAITPEIAARAGAALPVVPNAEDTRVVDPTVGIGDYQEGQEADLSCAIEKPTGLRPFQIDAIARKWAVKAFVGDLLAEMKRLQETA